MTIPIEEVRAVVATRDFLRSLLDPAQTPSPISATWLRRAALGLLRHYPWPDRISEAYRKARWIKKDEKP